MDDFHAVTFGHFISRPPDISVDGVSAAPGIEEHLLAFGCSLNSVPIARECAAAKHGQKASGSEELKGGTAGKIHHVLQVGRSDALRRGLAQVTATCEAISKK